jgi:hypothetical protein
MHTITTQRRNNLLAQLNTQLPYRYAHSGQGFASREALDRHLDELFARRRHSGGGLLSRSWFPADADWCLGSRVVSTKRKRSSAPADETQTRCALCCEEFEVYWDDKDEAWMYRDAVVLKHDWSHAHGKLAAGVIILVKALPEVSKAQLCAE